MKKNLIKIVFFFILTQIATSCMDVKAYQKMYINDRDMELTDRKHAQFEVNFEAYREGAAGANGGKVGGGCGCN